MKKIALFLIAAILVLSTAACGKQEKPAESSAAESAAAGSQSSSSEETAKPASVPESSGTESSSGSPAEGSVVMPAMIPGVLYDLSPEDGDEPLLRGLTLIGNQAGSGDWNAKEPASKGVRCIFEVSEWVEVYPDTDADDLRVWVIRHDDDRKPYIETAFSDLIPGFVTYCDLAPDPDDEAWPWGSFYLNPDDGEPGLYDLVFTCRGKAEAVLLTRFFAEGGLIDKTDAELDAVIADMVAEAEAAGAASGAGSSQTDSAAPGGSSASESSSSAADSSPADTGAGSGSGTSEAAAPSEGYSFPGYTENGTWPDAAVWAAMGLPDLQAADAGKVSISTKDWIYPLNAKDGVMIEARPGSSHFNEIVASLEGAGIVGEDLSDSFDSIYAADYTYGGEPMRVTVTEYDTGKLVVFVQYRPD